MEDEDFYLSVMSGIMEKEKKMIGEKVALARARKAPLQINPDGEIVEVYGDGKQAVDILVQQLETVAGKKVVDNGVQRYIKSDFDPEEYEKLPERLRPGYTPESGSSKGLIGAIKSKLA